MNYYIGDLHLFNRNQTDEGRNYDRRPFATVEEMNQYILERWNAKINNGDTVYILGDMAMRGKNSALLALVAQLKGKKILFRGNHDDLSDYRYQRLFEEITDYREIADSFDGKTYKLCSCRPARFRSSAPTSRTRTGSTRPACGCSWARANTS